MTTASKRIVAMSQWPTKYTVLLSLACGVVTVLNQTTFGLPTVWKTTLLDVLALFAFLKVGPTLGPKFRAALHLNPKVANAISLVLMFGMLLAQTDTGLPWRAVIIGVIQVAGGLGFAPTYVPTVTI